MDEPVRREPETLPAPAENERPEEEPAIEGPPTVKLPRHDEMQAGTAWFIAGQGAPS